MNGANVPELKKKLDYQLENEATSVPVEVCESVLHI